MHLVGLDSHYTGTFCRVAGFLEFSFKKFVRAKLAQVNYFFY